MLIGLNSIICKNRYSYGFSQHSNQTVHIIESLLYSFLFKKIILHVNRRKPNKKQNISLLIMEYIPASRELIYVEILKIKTNRNQLFVAYIYNMHKFDAYILIELNW